MATRDGDEGNPFVGAVQSAGSNMVIGFGADKLTAVGGHAIDKAMPSVWRKATGFDPASAELVSDAASGSRTTLNGLALEPGLLPVGGLRPAHMDGLAQATAQSGTPAGAQFLRGLERNLSEQGAGPVDKRRVGQIVFGAPTAESQAYSQAFGRLDPHSQAQVSLAMAGDKAVLDRMIDGRRQDAARRVGQGVVSKYAGQALKTKAQDEAEARRKAANRPGR